MPWIVFTLPALVQAGRDAVKRWRSNPEQAADAGDDGLTGFLFI